MTTKFIGVKELRSNLSAVADRMRRKNERLIVLRNNQPILELRPLSKKDATLEKLMMDIREAEEEVKAGRTYTLDEAEKMLGLV